MEPVSATAALSAVEAASFAAVPASSAAAISAASITPLTTSVFAPAAAAATSGWLSWASLGASVLGTGAQVMGAGAQARAQNASYQYQAQVARNNQLIADQLAGRASENSAAATQRQRQKTAAFIGSQEANQAASGLDINKGSHVDVRSSAAEMGELDRLTIQNAYEKEAFGYRVAGLSYGAQAAMDESAASNALTAGNLNMFSSVAGGASNFSDKWLRFKSAGLLT